MDESFTFDLLVKVNKIIFGYPWLFIKEKSKQNKNKGSYISTKHELLGEWALNPFRKWLVAT